MSVHKYTSWGRTRRPKPASGNDGDFITGSTLAALNDYGSPTGTDAANGVYQTENQRYAHIACSGSSTVSKVFTYSHAMANWHELKTVNPADGSRDSIGVGNDEYIIVDINGADYVALASGSLSVVTMAFSTF